MGEADRTPHLRDPALARRLAAVWLGAKMHAESKAQQARLGRLVRRRRRLMGMTQVALGTRCSTSFQQIQKYEAGGSRISASMLWRLACALEVPITYFCEGPCDPLSEAQSIALNDDQELVSAFESLRPSCRQALLALAGSMQAGNL